MKILITGGSGALGSELNKSLSLNNQILSIYNSNIGNCDIYNSIQTDITDKEKLKTIFAKFRPDIVVHTAAISNPVIVDKISSKKVYATNVTAVKNIAELCNKYNSKLIYTSTDLVYAGYRGTMLNEDSKLVPISLYAETKLMGEVKIKETFNNYLILRMSLMFGIGKFYKNNHFNKMYQNLINEKNVSLFTDQYRTPISFKEAARIISQLLKIGVNKSTINFGGKEKVSRFEKGVMLCEEAGLNKSLLLPVTMKDVNAAYQVKDVSMNTEKLCSFGIEQKSLHEMIRSELSSI